MQTNSGAENTMVVSELTWKGSRGDLLVFLGTGVKGSIVSLTNKEIMCARHTLCIIHFLHIRTHTLCIIQDYVNVCDRSVTHDIHNFDYA